MIDPAARSLLEFALDYIDANNTMVANAHLNPRTREIEPGSVRREVNAANAWLERARRALKPGEKIQQDVIRPRCDSSDVELIVREDECTVRVTFDRECDGIVLDVQRAEQLINALIRNTKIAGRKTGRIVEVKL